MFFCELLPSNPRRPPRLATRARATAQPLNGGKWYAKGNSSAKIMKAILQKTVEAFRNGTCMSYLWPNKEGS